MILKNNNKFININKSIFTLKYVKYSKNKFVFMLYI